VSAAVGLLVIDGVLVWPQSFGSRPLAILARTWMPASLLTSARTALRNAFWARMSPWRAGHRAAVSTPEPLALLEAIAPAREAGMAPAAALLIAADCRCDTGPLDHLDALVGAMASCGRKAQARPPLA